MGGRVRPQERPLQSPLTRQFGRDRGVQVGTKLTIPTRNLKLLVDLRRAQPGTTHYPRLSSPPSSCAAVDDAARGRGLGRFLLHSPQYRLLSTSASVPDGCSHLPQNKAASLSSVSLTDASIEGHCLSMRPESTLGYHISSFVANADSSNPNVWDL